MTKAQIKERIKASNEGVKNGLPPDEWVIEFRRKNNATKAAWKAKRPKKVFVRKPPPNKYTPEEKAAAIERNKQYKKAWAEKNKEAIAERLQKWRNENKEYLNTYNREKKRRNPSAKIAANLRKRLSALLRMHSAKKSKQTLHLLGCTMPDFMLHLQSKFAEGMSFENYGTWHIDHKRPCNSFDLTKPEQQAACFHYSNLQPLWRIENIIKSDKIAA